MASIKISDTEVIKLFIRKDFLVAQKNVFDKELFGFKKVWEKSLLAIEFPMSDLIRALTELNGGINHGQPRTKNRT